MSRIDADVKTTSLASSKLAVLVLEPKLLRVRGRLGKPGKEGPYQESDRDPPRNTLCFVSIIHEYPVSPNPGEKFQH
jgi:hypothetical protein